MAKGSKAGKNKIGHANYELNKKRRIKTEIKKVTKKMEKLLRLYKEGRPRNCKDNVRTIQGIKSGSERHNKLQSYISTLKKKL